ncbi:hypothetical protein RH831_08830 [Halodesulfurarchaeum sp. HSR-GB]|uniref:hypothetical protein n=1 Tax=Halodesulfurarchaeum sp. HSR-GB TaxID=3074077 RepID=UPI00285A162F|nr:hypothetical protein [Halodesulfurarchaeum sp. HSR-GB]MDR5657283.1 hypothetical protein [Halodesulfurarchaeum sp. HSR-GB]
MGLEAYESYWSSQGYSAEKRRRRMAKIRQKAGIDSGWGSASDPIGAQTPMVQDSMLQQLARRASGENGRIDDWQSLIDPTVSYGANLRKILQKGGKELESTIKEDRKNWIESGEADKLRGDIADEFGESFVSAAIAEAKALETPAEDIRAPEPVETPTEPETPSIQAEPEPEPVETPAEPETPSIQAEPEPEPIEATAEAETPAKPDYSGVFGTFRLLGEFLKASFRAGMEDSGKFSKNAQTGEKSQKTLSTY